MLRAGRSGVRIPVETSHFCPLQNVQKVLGSTAAYSMGIGVIFRRQGGRGVKLNTHLQLVPRLRMKGTALFLPLNAFMTRRGRILPLPLNVIKTLSVGYYYRSFTRAAVCARNNVFFWHPNKVTILAFSQCDYSCTQRFSQTFFFRRKWDEFHKIIGKGTDLKSKRLMTQEH
jgi:hypothetical protein